MRLTIPRSKWLRAGSELTQFWASQLWHKKADCGCVLGHYGIGLGIEPDVLHGCVVPEETIDGDESPWPLWLVEPELATEEDANEHLSPGDRLGWMGTELAVKAIAINDDPNIWDDERERQLTELFAAHDVQLEFIDA